MRLVLVIPASEHRAQEQRISLREEGLDIGGAADCDAVVDHPSVGTARVRLERRGDAWIVIDREGRGMCSVGGVPLRPREPRIVRPPHHHRLGELDLELAFDLEDSQDGATRDVAMRAAAFVAEVAPSRPRVRVVEGPRMGELLDLPHAGAYRVGRGKSCDFLLDADDASREHFTIECHPGRVVVRDLGSARGTFLGRSRLEPHRGAVWDPSRMLRAVDTVFSLEVATAESPDLLLAPLERIADDTPPELIDASEEPGPPPQPEASSEPAAPEDACLSATSSPIAEPPSGVAGEPSRRAAPNPTYVIVVIAAVIGITGIGVLLAIFLW